MIKPSPTSISACESRPSGAARRFRSRNPNALVSHSRAAIPSSYESIGMTDGVLVAAARRFRVAAAFLPAARRFRVVAAWLAAARRIAGQIANHENLGMARDGEVGFHLHPPGAI